MELLTAPALLAAGEVVAERYRIVQLLGEGGMGVVYLAEHVHMHKRVALKVLHGDFGAHAEVLARFEREAIAAGRIDHPNVTAATDFGRLPDGAFFLVLEYVAGRTLRDELDHGALPVERSVRIARGIAAGLGAAHAIGIVHRDLKPENVMLAVRDGDDDFVKVLDFGIAKLDPAGRPGRAGAQGLTVAGAVLGTPDYMSPEQALGQGVDARTDFYALGIVLFEMLTGERPFRGGAMTVMRDRILAETPPELPPEAAARVDPRVLSIVRRLLRVNAGERFQTAAELVVALDEAAVVASPAARSPAGRERVDPLRATMHAVSAPLVLRLRSMNPRTRRGVGIAAVAVAVAVAALVLLGVASPSRTTARPDGATTGASGSASSESSSESPVDNPPPLDLPPPPSPVASAPAHAKPEASEATPGSGARRTGPGGIYIPPPSRWFK